MYRPIPKQRILCTETHDYLHLLMGYPWLIAQIIHSVSMVSGDFKRLPPPQDKQPRNPSRHIQKSRCKMPPVKRIFVRQPANFCRPIAGKDPKKPLLFFRHELSGQRAEQQNAEGFHQRHSFHFVIGKDPQEKQKDDRKHAG